MSRAAAMRKRHQRMADEKHERRVMRALLVRVRYDVSDPDLRAEIDQVLGAFQR